MQVGQRSIRVWAACGGEAGSGTAVVLQRHDGAAGGMLWYFSGHDGDAKVKALAGCLIMG